MKNKLIQFTIIICLLFWVQATPLDTQVYNGRQICPIPPPESELLAKMFDTAKDGIVFCEANRLKTTGIFVSKDGWILTAGHLTDRDFTAVSSIQVKLTRAPDAKVFQSTEVLPLVRGLDLLLLKIDYKPKFYFKRFKVPAFFEENWIFGFRLTSAKVPSSPGYVTQETQYSQFLLTTATSIGGNSGSPVLNRSGCVLGIIIMGYTFGDSLFIPADIVKEYIDSNLRGRK